MKPEGRALAVASLLRAGWSGKALSEGLKVTDSGGSVQEAMEAMRRVDRHLEPTITVTLEREEAELLDSGLHPDGGAVLQAARAKLRAALTQPQPEQEVRFDLPERLRTDDLGADIADELRSSANSMRESLDCDAGGFEHAAMLDEAAEIVEWAGGQVEAADLRPQPQPESKVSTDDVERLREIARLIEVESRRDDAQRDARFLHRFAEQLAATPPQPESYTREEVAERLTSDEAAEAAVRSSLPDRHLIADVEVAREKKAIRAALSAAFPDKQGGGRGNA